MKQERAEIDRLSDLMKHKLVELHNKAVTLRKEKETIEGEKNVLEQKLLHNHEKNVLEQKLLNTHKNNVSVTSNKKVSFIETGETPVNKTDPVVSV